MKAVILVQKLSAYWAVTYTTTHSVPHHANEFRSFKFKLVTGPLHKIRRFTRVLLITSTNNNRASTVILLLHLVINKNAFEEMY